MLNPEKSQDEDDNVVVMDDSEKQLENVEVLASKGQGRVGRHAVGSGKCDTPATHRIRVRTARTTKTRRMRSTVTRRRAMRRIGMETWTRASGSS